MATRSLNKVLLIGNLTRDPELRYTPQGTAVCTFGLATNRTWTPADGGEQQEAVEFHRIVAWAKLAEICAQILYKGRKAFIEGRLQTREWTDTEGRQRNVTEVVVDNMIALGAPKSGGPGAETYEAGAEEYAPAASQPAAVPDQVIPEVPTPAKTTKKTPTKSQKVKTDKSEEVSGEDIPF